MCEKMKLYLAPANIFSNYVYRHLMLQNDADYVFSEVIMIKRIDKEIQNDKLKVFQKDLPKTIFQIGVSSKEEIDTAIKLLPNAKEININMGCPQSSMKDICGGLLKNEKLMDTLTSYLVKICKKYKIVPSVKIRLGTSISDIRISKYLKIFEKNNIKKVYIHARPLRYSYNKPAIYKPLFTLPKYKLKLIINGDIDNYNKCKFITDKIVCDIMIGRAAFSNPFIFNQIKNKFQTINNTYNPIKKDPEIIKKGSQFYFSDKKKEFIEKYIKLAKEERLRKEIVEYNLRALLKGITHSKIIVKQYLDRF